MHKYQDNIMNQNFLASRCIPQIAGVGKGNLVTLVLRQSVSNQSAYLIHAACSMQFYTFNV